jgi:uncharacterized protein (DUF433 family)
MKEQPDLLNRITIDNDICHGKPTIRGSRIMVKTILELLSSGMTYEEILEDYPKLEYADIMACLSFATRLVDFRSVNLQAAA